MQVQNRELWNETRSFQDADFFTIGYSGRNKEQFLESLRTGSIATVVDIRANPVSMYKPDFSKRNLECFLGQNGMEYVHVPELGVPREVRGLVVGSESRGLIWDWYDGNVGEPLTKNLYWFFNALAHPIALMCVELDPTSCHRHRLTLALEAKRLRGYEL